MTSRKIKLKRKEIIRFGLPEEFKQDKVCNLGSYADKNGNTSRPLTYEEEDKWMEQIVGLAPKDPGFRAAITKWYATLTLKVVPEGIELEVGVDTNGNPLNLEEWIKFKFAENHPWTARTEKECKSHEHLQFWFEDPEADNVAKGKTLEIATKAYVEFAKLTDDKEKMDWVLRTVISKFTDLGSLSELIALPDDKKRLKISEVIQKDPQFFLDVMADKDLVFKAEIASMVEAGVIMREGNKYLNGTETLGSLDGTIAWMKDANNAMEYAVLKARLDEFGTPVAKKVTAPATKKA